MQNTMYNRITLPSIHKTLAGNYPVRQNRQNTNLVVLLQGEEPVTRKHVLQQDQSHRYID